MLIVLLQPGEIAGRAEFINSANNTVQQNAKIARQKVVRNFGKYDKRWHDRCLKNLIEKIRILRFEEFIF